MTYEICIKTDKIDYIPIIATPDDHSKVRFKKVAQYITFSVESMNDTSTVGSSHKHRRLSERRVTLFAVFPQSESLAELILSRDGK